MDRQKLGKTDGTHKQRSGSTDYERLRSFLVGSMSMSHIYQPLMIRTILAGGGAATRRQIAGAFLSADLSQLEYYEHITKGYPTQTLRRHGIIDHDRGVYRLLTPAGGLGEWERASLIALCDAKVAEYVALRQDAIWRHRTQNFEPVPGTIRYEVIRRAMGRCEACGVSNRERALQVDHIIPRARNGSNDLHNLQALCSACNSQKLDRDVTDFHITHDAYEARAEDCLYCNAPPSAVIAENSLARVLQDTGSISADHLLIVPKRHASDYFELWQPEINAVRQLERMAARHLRDNDQTITDFTLKVAAAGSPAQAMVHCHIHLIPHRSDEKNDVTGSYRVLSCS